MLTKYVTRDPIRLKCTLQYCKYIGFAWYLSCNTGPVVNITDYLVEFYYCQLLAGGTECYPWYEEAIHLALANVSGEKILFDILRRKCPN